jgi:hypothetical protein
MDKIQLLHDKKVDTIIYYHVECTGGMIRMRFRDSCVAYDIKYLLWIDSNKYFIQKFAECFEYEPSNISSSFFDLIRHNYLKIKSSKIQNPRFTEIIKGKAVNETSFIDHTCHNIFEMQIGNRNLTKKIDDYNLETKYVDGHFNKNYYRNKKSILNKLKMMLEKEAALYNKNPHNKKGAQ